MDHVGFTGSLPIGLSSLAGLRYAAPRSHGSRSSLAWDSNTVKHCGCSESQMPSHPSLSLMMDLMTHLLCAPPLPPAAFWS
jgi:hypothetical protein